MKRDVYITTAIDYVNDVIHIGHAYQKVLADCVARYYKETLKENKVFFLTGTDEYGQKVFNEAKDRKENVKRYVDKISKADQNEQDYLNISYDRFIRTTDEDHKKKVTEFYNKVLNNDKKYIYKGKYKGLYCEGCEAFKTKRDLTKGKCNLHPNKKIKTMEEENYFFKWSSFRSFLKKHFDSNPSFVLPQSRYNEMYKFIGEIEDIPITRTKDKLPWGIQAPNDPNHVIWVWFDALINYVTFGDKKNIWNKDTRIIHFLGKDNARMHSLLWPAMLKASGYILPNTIYVNGFLSLNGQKISKSLGNVIKPSDLINKFKSSDAIRYYLLKYGPIVEDADISIEKLKRSYQSDLANDLGNLVSRVSALLKDTNINKAEKSNNHDLLKEIQPEMESFRVDLALEKIWTHIRSLNRHLNQKKPWEKKGGEKLKILSEIIFGSNSLISLLNISRALKPFIPKTAERIENTFSKSPIKTPRHLFPKIPW